MKSLFAAFCLLCLSLPCVAADEGHPLSMWRVSGASNDIYLLGSIHMLRESDYPLPSVMYDAYRDAETLVMEIDMDDMDPFEDQAIAAELGLINDGRTLRDLLGASNYSKAESMAAELNIPLMLLDQSEPWFAAITVEVMMLMRIGFNPMHGIESHFADMAVRDSKEILGFETTRQQLEFLDNLSPATQRDMLLQTLADSMKISEMMDQMIDAWYFGKVDFLEQNLLSEMQKFRELHDTIVVRRNRNWVERINAMLREKDDYLIVVGALHLIGDQGVPKLLAARGHKVTQLHQPAN
ncbi:MAG: TraB/GumN family protein [Woeseiaceae bacterium]|nr:TraB/GumN family protein [Woeseiaceae bacterium]